MNVQNLRDNYPKLISYMETSGYSKTYVGKFKREIKKSWLLWVQISGHATGIYIWRTLKHQAPLIISAKSGL